MAPTQFWVCVHCDHELGDMTLGQGMTHPSVIDNNCVKYYLDPTWQWGVIARTPISSMCALWPWPWRYDLGSSSWHTLGSWTTIVWNIIQIQLGSEELWPGYGFPVYVHCDLDLTDMTLGQGHDTLFGHGQQLCEILSRSNLAVRSYGPDTDFQYMCTVTLTLEIWPWVKVMTHPWVMDNNCVKYYLDPTWQWGVKLPGHGFLVYVHCDLDLEDMTSGQGHDTPLGHGQQLCEILSRSNLAVRSYGPDTDFHYMCTVTLTLEIWPWVKVMTHPWVMDNNCVIYYPDPTWQWGVMARTRISSMCALWPWPWRYDLLSRSWHILGSWTTIVWNYIQIGQGSTKLWPGHDVNRRTDRQTDRQTGWFLYTPQTLFAGGINMKF